jgi:hypothetical protein
LAIDCGGGIYTGGVSVSVNGTLVPILSTGGTIGNGSCVNLQIRNNTAIIYQITYGGGFSGCSSPGFVYDEVRNINFAYNALIGSFGGYDYLEQYYQGGSLISGTTKQTAIVNPAADLGNGCPTQDLDLVVRFYIQGGILPSPTPTNTPSITPTNTSTPTLTPTPTITPSSTPVPIFVAGGETTNKLGYSNDGITWSASTNGNSIFGTGVFGLGWNGSRFVAGGVGTNVLGYSNDGLTWSASTNGNTIFATSGASPTSHSVSWNGSKFIVVGNTYAGPGVSNPRPVIAYSTDGITWSASTNTSVAFGVSDLYASTSKPGPNLYPPR